MKFPHLLFGQSLTSSVQQKCKTFLSRLVRAEQSKCSHFYASIFQGQRLTRIGHLTYFYSDKKIHKIHEAESDKQTTFLSTMLPLTSSLSVYYYIIAFLHLIPYLLIIRNFVLLAWLLCSDTFLVFPLVLDKNRRNTTCGHARK